MKVAGSLLSFRGIKVTGASGLAATLGAAATGGGDTGRVADAVRGMGVLGGAVLAALGALFGVGALVLGVSELTGTLSFACVGAGAACKLDAFELSSSFSLFAMGSGSYFAATGDGDRRAGGGSDVS